eukprot:GGOE01009738.1.p1 GENE.GGOE01009738.1~~GGOE01009738.1.p1  ORF type:complete len:440 (-),score=142.03 GGOE01009738.1:160-1434(-)
MAASGAYKAHEKEFGGTLGAFAIVIALPLVIHALFFFCVAQYCISPSNFWEAPTHLPSTWQQVFDPSALAVVIGWIASLVVLERILPGPLVSGLPLRDKSILTYRLNGHLTFWVIISVLAGLQTSGVINLSYCYTYYAQLATAAILLTLTLSVLLYAASFRRGAMLALGGDTGSAVYDFFIGRELNPRIGSFDLKEFCELRPGLIGWMVLNVGMLLAQYERTGHVTPSMWLVNLFQALYVWDALYHEASLLSTMDITTDGFGFMLAFGDMAWVPFTYSLQARYLVDHDPGFSWPALAAICTVQVLGFTIFRRANSQKDAFRRNPDAPEVKHLRSLPTKRGTRLLTSGWWGLARKINYTGDWLVGLSWCLLCGFDSIVPYFYSIYFFVLLVQRAMRDNQACALKYGEDWKRYTELVPYIFIPYII